MNPEMLLDAMQYLPDAMLERTDRLRQKKHISWQNWAAMAACLCLVLSVACVFMIPGAASKDNTAAPEQFLGDMQENCGSLTDGDGDGGLFATVIEVKADSLTVKLATGEQKTVLLTAVAERPDLEPGMKIRIYLDDPLQKENQEWIPYKIEIEEA